jgi:CRISPR-associated protein Cmr5
MTQEDKKSLQQTLQQKRAAHAWECIEKVRDQSSYKSQVGRLPALIRSDGLGQTLAFLKAKDGKSERRGSTGYIEIYNNISNWIASPDSGIEAKYEQGKDLLDWLIHQDTPTYRRVTVEALAYVSWLKRFAEGAEWKDEGDE